MFGKKKNNSSDLSPGALKAARDWSDPNWQAKERLKDSMKDLEKMQGNPKAQQEYMERKRKGK